MKNGIPPNQISRRRFLKLCTAVAVTLGMGAAGASKVMAALTSSQRPPVIWLHMAECTGCSEALLRTTSPYVDDLIMDVISLEYHETLMAASGWAVENALYAAVERFDGEFFCVVEGSIPTAQGGIYGMVGGRTMLETAAEICPRSAGVIAMGTCASYGGLAAAAPNPTGAKGVSDALAGSLGVPVVNLPGCPPNPINLIATLADYLLQGSLPPRDSLGRPLFAYGTRVHSRCPYRDGPLEERCLEDYGCKGKVCYNNCPSVQFNDRSFPMKAGHPCIGCAQPNFWDTMTPFYQEEEDD